MFKNSVSALRTIAFIEGISYLVLLFIAMPLKYGADMPGAVRVVGMIHGVLFVIFCVALLQVMVVAKWPMSRGALVFLSSIVPFGPWMIDRRFKQYEAEFLSRRAGERSSPRAASEESS